MSHKLFSVLVKLSIIISVFFYVSVVWYGARNLKRTNQSNHSPYLWPWDYTETKTLSPNEEYNRYLHRKTLEEIVNITKLEFKLSKINLNEIIPSSVIILATWRTGSTFLGEIISSYPGMFYHFEPFARYGFTDVNVNPLNGKVSFELNNLLQCKYSVLPEYFHCAKHDNDAFPRNKLVWNLCNNIGLRRICFTPKFMEEACQLFPYQVVKTVRIRLKTAKALLHQESHAETRNIKFILLVRDPRAILSSRTQNIGWCTEQTCLNATYLCEAMLDDYKTAVRINVLYPGRLILVRYEDLAINPFTTTERIMKFLGLTMNQKIKNFLYDHTKTDDRSPWSTSRKLGSRVQRWKTGLPFEDIIHIQNSCEEVMKILGYKTFYDEKEMRLQNSVLPLKVKHL